MPIPKIVVTAALMAAQVALGMTRRFKGPRLESLKTTTAEYGTPIPRFWGKRKFECPVIWAEELRETKKKHKGKGGKQTEYRYFATFAVLIADHEIDAVLRIWMDDKLVFDATGSGPRSLASLFVNQDGLRLSERNMRTYLGTETQEPDPRMEEWCEDRYGADSCPAYRGSAYVVFEELPVNNFGNRIPNVTVEAVSAKTDAFPYEEKSTAEHMGNGETTTSTFSPDFAYYLIGDEVWDAATRTRLFTIDRGEAFHHTMDANGVVWSSTGLFGVTLRSTTLEGALIADYPCEANADWSFCVAGGVYMRPLWAGNDWALNLAGDEVVKTALDFAPTIYFEDTDGNAWAAGRSTTDGTVVGFYNFANATQFTLTSPEGKIGYVGAMDNGQGQFFCRQDDSVFLVDKATQAVVDSAIVPAGADAVRSLRHVQPGATSAWFQATEISTIDLSVIRTLDLTDWDTPEIPGQSLYDPVNHALITQADFSGKLVWRFLDRVSSAGVTLKTIVDDVSGWCGITGHDSTALTQSVAGYSVTQGAGKDMLAPLLDLYDVDCRPHDFQLQFVNRGSAPSGSTIETEDFVREGDESRYTVTIQQDTDLPRKVTLNFADSTHDQQTNTVIAQRPLDAVDSQREETIDGSTFVDTPDGAQQKIDRYFRRVWNSRERPKLSLTAQHLALEPADVRTISLDGVSRNVRLDKMTIAGLRINCEFVRDETSFAALNSSSGAGIEGRDPDELVIPSVVKGFVLDIPLVEDVDSDINPLLYVAAGDYGGTFVGAGVYRGDDGTYDELAAYVETDAEATWGFAMEALATANPNLWDRGNSLDVTVYGTLTSSTEAAIDANPSVNLCAIGVNGRWEVLNFVTATLTGTSGTANTYTLSGFKRGRRGTEMNVGNHETGDGLLMLANAHIIELGTDEIGDDLSFKVQSPARDPETAPAIDFTFAGNTLKPRAPAVRYISKEADGDILIHIAQRPRTGGNWNGATIPVVESSESYELDIYDGATFKRTLTATSSPITYSLANQTSDFGAAVATDGFDGELSQISAVVDRGFVRTL